ncbi:MAG: hypothetical protein EXR65_04070 [Dehalococcoidia bacterium]|nr:hypothetical protein [Dehalococcoidia bacterium]
MFFVLVLGVMLGVATVVLLGQWAGEALDPGAERFQARLPQAGVAPLGGLVFVRSRRGRRAA